MAGLNTGVIQASYSVGAVSAGGHATGLGGLVGSNTFTFSGTTFTGTVTNSYWDMEASGQALSSAGTGSTTVAMTAPTDYSGIYSAWNLDLNGDGSADNLWNFGTARQYPGLNIGNRTHRPGAFFPCGENIELRPWHDIYADGVKYSHATRSTWAEGCQSRNMRNRHARYFTFTLTQQTQVRLEAEGVSPVNPRLFLRPGVSHIPLHNGSVYGNPLRSRIDEKLSPGTYTLEVTTDRPAGTGFQFELWAGTPRTLPVLTTPGTDVLVGNVAYSNFGQRDAVLMDHAQAFTTGAHPTGYTLTAAQIYFHSSTTGSPNSYSVKICRESSGRPSTSCLGTLTNPSSLVTGRPTSFTAPGDGIGLDPNTTYFVVWDVSSPGSANVPIRSTLSDAEDSDVAPGWSIADNAWERTYSATDWGAHARARQIVIGGYTNPCFEEIDRGETAVGLWISACSSTENPGSYARYYVYTPAADGSMTVTLTSPDAEEEVFLYEDGTLVAQHSSNVDSSCYPRCASVHQPVKAAKQYAIEVTTNNPGRTGRYLLALRGSSAAQLRDYDPAGAEVSPAGCRQTATVEGGPAGTRPNGWAWGQVVSSTLEWPCHSVEYAGHYARYFTFTVSSARQVAIELPPALKSRAHLYVRAGTKGSGDHLVHVPPWSSSSGELETHFATGTYTVEVVSRRIGDGGDFSLVIKEPPPKYTPAAHCVTDLGTIKPSSAKDRDGEWRSGSGCRSYRFGSGDAHYYRFTLTGPGRILLALDSEDANSYLALHEGASFSGSPMAENDDNQYEDSFIEARLGPGTYTVEATTNPYQSRRTGEYEFALRRRE